MDKDWYTSLDLPKTGIGLKIQYKLSKWIKTLTLS